MKIFRPSVFCLISGVLIFGTFSTHAQETTKPFSPEELTAFAIIFNETKKIENSIDVEIIALLQEYNVSYGRYREVITNNIKGVEMSSFSENEKKFFEAVNSKNEALSTRVEKMEIQLCKENFLEPNTYFTIKKQFVTSPKFQNEIYPYFEKIISGDNRD